MSGDSSGRHALEELCQRYWSPLYQFIRARGYNEAEAKDLTQEFLLHLLEHATLQKADRLRGRFRSFLCGALVRFLRDASDKRRAQKRGGGAVHVELDSCGDHAPASSAPEELLFDREWALVILENALRTVERAGWGDAPERAGTAEGRFAVLRQFLPGSVEVPSYEAAATQLRLSVPALKSELHRLRQRFKAAVREEVAATVSAPHEIDQELHHLQQVLMNKGVEWSASSKPSPPIP